MKLSCCCRGSSFVKPSATIRAVGTSYVTVEMSREDSQSKVSKRDILSRRELEKEAARAIGENLEPQWKRA